MKCSTCTTQCTDCADFELSVSEETNIGTLKMVRKVLLQHKIKPDDSITGKIADWLTAKIGTMACVAFFLAFANLPFAFPRTLEIVQFIGGTDIPLVLMPLIMVAANRTDKIREMRAAHEYRIQLVYDRIEELREEGSE